MREFVNCNRSEFEGGCVCYDDVFWMQDESCSIYLGPSGVYVISSKRETVTSLFASIREQLGTVHVRLFLTGEGCYENSRDEIVTVTEGFDLQTDINAWITEGRVLYKQQTIDRMCAQIEYQDAISRGYKVDSEGRFFLYRGGKFKEISNIDSDHCFLMALFGGIFGLHRFALGKWFSGFCYLLTGGMFLVGWFFDILFILFGIMKDKDKRYLMPVSNPGRKVFWVPIGFVCSLLLLMVYVVSINYLLNGIGASVLS